MNRIVACEQDSRREQNSPAIAGTISCSPELYISCSRRLFSMFTLAIRCSWRLSCSRRLSCSQATILFSYSQATILFTGGCCKVQTADYADCRLQTTDYGMGTLGPQTHAYILMPIPSRVDVLPPALRFNNDMPAVRICSSSCSVKQHS